MKRSFLLGIAAAAATSAPVFFQAPAQAACIPDNSTCTTFDPSSASSPDQVSGFSGSYTNATPLTRVRVIFQTTGTFSTPFTISGIKLFGAGLNPAGETLADVSFTGSPTSSAFITGLNLTSQNFNTSKISFTIPSGIATAGSGATLTALINYQNEADPTLYANTSATPFTTTVKQDTTETPSPLPLLGAGAAFGFSRRLRSRVRLAA